MKITDGEFTFCKSPESLYCWAPFANELKYYDGEIVKNLAGFH
jgi:hypothetical protein